MNKDNCPNCQSEMVWERRTIQYEREGIPITLKNVWLRTCSECGHESVPGPVAIQLLNLADQLFQSAQQLQAITHLPAPQILLSFPETDSVPDALLSPA
jgi:YgiT-type zinc finger domain-containing protein